ncbi:MAG TPA: hypothetical protein VF139_00830 [Candidatus Polarisedimenticolaceae bacterium]
MSRRVAIALLEATLPRELAEPVIGDLVEAHARQPVRFWIETLRALRLVDPRVPAAGLSGALLACAFTVVAFRWSWGTVLSLVPFRAGHEPPASWIVPFVFVTAGLAVAGAVVGARLAKGSSR